MTRTRSPKAPIAGAVRCYKLVPSDAPDAYEAAAAMLAARGFTAVEADYSFARTASGRYVTVAMWAVPPTVVPA